MGIADAFSRDDRFEIKTESFIRMAQAAAKAEAEVTLLMNAVRCNVPHKYIREVMTGVSEEDESPQKSENSDCEEVD